MLLGSGRTKITNDLLKEIELIQKRQDNINSELNLLRQECNNLRNNGNSNNLHNNIWEILPEKKMTNITVYLSIFAFKISQLLC